MAHDPKVSIVMPAYNAADTIAASIESVQAQTSTDWELLVVDDGSKDDTAEIVRSFADDRITLTTQENAGVSAARNRALEQARGKYVAFLDSDDLWLPEKLARQVEVMDADPEVVLCYAEHRLFFDDPQTSFPHPYPDVADIADDHHRLIVWDYIGTLTAMVRRDVLDQVGHFDTSLFGPEDWDLWLRVAARGKIARINEPLALYRESASGISKAKDRQLAMERRVLEKAIKNYAPPKSVVRTAWWYMRLKECSLAVRKGDIQGAVTAYLKAVALDPWNRRNLTFPLRRLRAVMKKEAL